MKCRDAYMHKMYLVLKYNFSMYISMYRRHCLNSGLNPSEPGIYTAYRDEVCVDGLEKLVIRG